MTMVGPGNEPGHSEVVSQPGHRISKQETGNMMTARKEEAPSACSAKCCTMQAAHTLTST